MHCLKNIKLIVLAWLLVCNSSFAGALDNVRKLLSESGVESDVTNSSVYKSQGASYYHGGSVVVRPPVKTLQPFRFDPPIISSGGSDFDLVSGGFDYISKEKLISYLKNISFVPLSYPFMPGLQIVSPQMKNTLGWLNDLRKRLGWMNDLRMKAHQISTNANDLGARLVSGLVSQNGSYKQLEDKYLSDGEVQA